MRSSFRLGLASLATGLVLSSCRFGYELFPPDDSASVGGSGFGGESSGGAFTGDGGDDGGGLGGAAAGGNGAGGSASGGAGTGGVSFGEEPYCEKIQMLPSDPVIDGQVDAGLPLQFVQPMAFRVHADNPDPYKTFPPGVTLDVAVAWRPNGLYFFFRIVDPDYNPAPDGQAEWGGDGAEIYVDHDAVFAPAGAYDDPGTNSFIFEGPPDDADVGGASGRYIPYTRVGDFGGQWLSQKTVDGYVVEAFIAAADLGLADWSIGAGSSLAFDVGHNVSFPPGTTSPDFNRLGQYFLRAADPLAGVEADYPFFNSALFCVPEVSAD